MLGRMWRVFVVLFVVVVMGSTLASAQHLVQGTATGVIRGWDGQWEIFKLSSNWADPDWARSDQMHEQTRAAQGYPKQIGENVRAFKGTMGGRLEFEQTLAVADGRARVESAWRPVESFSMRQLQYTVDLLASEYGGDSIVIDAPGGDRIVIDVPMGSEPMEREYIGRVERIELRREGEVVLAVEAADVPVHVIDLRKFGNPIIRMAWNVFNDEPTTVEPDDVFSFAIELSY